jgi:hypothetical protein
MGSPYVTRLVWVLTAIALATPGLSQLFAATTFAQDVTSNAAAEDDAPLDMRRDQWRERVAEARRRSQQFALEHRGRPAFDPPSIADQERMLSAQVLNDDSLEPGDIVSTNKGLFVFKGQSDQERRESDFMALSPR